MLLQESSRHAKTAVGSALIIGVVVVSRHNHFRVRLADEAQPAAVADVEEDRAEGVALQDAVQHVDHVHPARDVTVAVQHVQHVVTVAVTSFQISFQNTLAPRLID